MGKKAIPVTVGVVALIIVFIAIYTNTASFQRSLKSVKSDFGNGLMREIIVYDSIGDEIYRQKGKFDIEYNGDDRVMYDDEQGNRHNIYFKTGTVIVNEVDE